MCLSHVIDFIYDYEPKDRFWGKQIKLIVSGNHQFLNMINKVEGEKRPNLINMNLSRARKIVTSSANLSISMTVYPVSCGISRYDDILFLTPYTHIGGDRSPTYRIDKGENAELFDHYKNYMEKLLEAAVNVTAQDTEKNLKEKIFAKMCDSHLLKTEECVDSNVPIAILCDFLKKEMRTPIATLFNPYSDNQPTKP